MKAFALQLDTIPGPARPDEQHLGRSYKSQDAPKPERHLIHPSLRDPPESRARECVADGPKHHSHNRSPNEDLSQLGLSILRAHLKPEWYQRPESPVKRHH